jgi:hypothetical protein
MSIKNFSQPPIDDSNAPRKGLPATNEIAYMSAMRAIGVRAKEKTQ